MPKKLYFVSSGQPTKKPYDILDIEYSLGFRFGDNKFVANLSGI